MNYRINERNKLVQELRDTRAAVLACSKDDPCRKILARKILDLKSRIPFLSEDVAVAEKALAKAITAAKYPLVELNIKGEENGK